MLTEAVMRTAWFGVGVSLGLLACGSSVHPTPPSAQDGNGSIARGGGNSAATGSPGSGGVATGSSSGGSGGFGGGSTGGGETGGGSSGGGAFVGGGAASGSGSSFTSTAPASTDAGADGGPVLPPQATGSAGVLTAGLWDDGLNYPFFTGYVPSHQGIPGDPGFAMSDYGGAASGSNQRVANSLLDAALVIDTTGSMGDEISYLTAEFEAIAGAIATQFPNAAQRWALVTYRDTPDYDPGDAYVVKSYDFTASTATFASTVGAQTANGGGDYPESPELGLEEIPKLTWRTDPSVAKVAFWVGDAPHHAERAAAMKQAILDARSAGVHLYPVSASGTDDLLELTMRSAAELTGGRYLFLTNDSGVGDTHKTPEIPCYFVTRLEKALVRVVSMELSGQSMAPDSADILRVSGDVTANGTCSVGDGEAVQLL